MLRQGAYIPRNYSNRAEQIGGTLPVTSKPGAGTRIVAVSSYSQSSS